MRNLQIAATVLVMTEHSHEGHFEGERVADDLALEAELASGISAEAVAFCAERFAAQGRTVERVADLGSGPGVDTVRLAECFPSATVVAADGSATMLARVESRAERLGLADRVETRAVDLDGDLQGVGRCDLAWSGMAIHHVADEVATLGRIRALLRPGGLVCLLERADPMSVRLADDLGRPGLWDRLDAARSGAAKAERYPGMLASAGLGVIVARTLTDTVTPPEDPATRRFLTARLRATARNLADFADPADLGVLEAVLDPSWDGVTVTSSRKLFIAHPAAGPS
jgi:SAM-dependent methyltransferase